MANKATALESCTHRIEGDLTIFEALEAKKTLDSLLENCSEVELDLSAVSEVDTAGMQLLIYAKQQMTEKNGALKLTNHSEPVVESLDLYNLHGYFGDPVLLTSDRKGVQA